MGGAVGRYRYYFTNRDTVERTGGQLSPKWHVLNQWDMLLLMLIIAGLFFLGWIGSQITVPYHLGAPVKISLDPHRLPGYALRTVARLFIALLISLIFTFIVGTFAAKNRRAEKLIIPAIDVLQSVPVLSFLAITVSGFIHVFPGSMLGPECASIFAIFTSQVWNITFSFYQSLKTIPADLQEAGAMYQLSAWQQFWKIEVPCSMSGLLWNVMISMSASWFFVVLSEAISVAHQDIQLPGIGSYIAMAIEKRNLNAIGYAILTMIGVIFIYDQLLFRPLIAWSDKFKLEEQPDDANNDSWVINWLRASRLMYRFELMWYVVKEKIINTPWLSKKGPSYAEEEQQSGKIMDWIWFGLVSITILVGFYCLSQYIFNALTYQELWHVVALGALTGLRVLVLIILSSLLWIPVGVWIGMRPHWAHKIQPVIQFLAAIPANLFYPLFVIAILHFHLNVEIWVTPLMILGTQWYILFNVIAGASVIPRDLCLAADNFGVTGWQWWRRLVLPAIFPFYITGALSAAGGAWNASIVAEWVSYGATTLKATGLGEYIQASTFAGDFPKIALGTSMMCLYVLLCNHLIWRPLYRLAQERYV